MAFEATAMRKRWSAAVALLSLFAMGCTSYSIISIDLRQLQDVGRDGVSISMQGPDDVVGRGARRQAVSETLGHVSGSARTWMFANCEAAAEAALSELAAQARARGSEHVTSLRFRSKWRWVREPVCRRNYTYALLLIPLFLPVPSSVTVSGVAE